MHETCLFAPNTKLHIGLKIHFTVKFKTTNSTIIG